MACQCAFGRQWHRVVGCNRAWTRSCLGADSSLIVVHLVSPGASWPCSPVAVPITILKMSRIRTRYELYYLPLMTMMLASVYRHYCLNCSNRQHFCCCLDTAPVLVSATRPLSHQMLVIRRQSRFLACLKDIIMSRGCGRMIINNLI